MKWLQWLPRLLVEPAANSYATPDALSASVPSFERLGIREVGNCEVCGRSMQARTRRPQYRGRVDCDCGHRNHVDYREVRSDLTSQPRHVTVTSGHKFEAATHEPDRRLAWRYGICPSCGTAVRLLDAVVVAREDSAGSVETFAYYCTACHVHDDARRGRLMGRDGSHIVDTLRFLVRHGTGDREPRTG